MLSLSALVKILRFLWKAILGFVLVFITILFVIHIPWVQKQITNGLSEYLASEINAQVRIKRVEFSIFGNLSIFDLEVWTPANEKLISVREMHAAVNLFDLISGNFIFERIRLAGVEGKLLKNESGLNIQFIIDAFQSDKEKSPTKKKVNLVFLDLQLEDIRFEYMSVVDGLKVTADLGNFQTSDLQLFTNPVSIKAKQIVVKNTSVKTLVREHNSLADTVLIRNEDDLFKPDFGTGINVDVGQLTFEHNDFLFNRDTVMVTRKFDVNHLQLMDIQLNVSNILMHKDTLAAKVKSVSAEMPDFKLTDLSSDLRMNSRSATVSSFNLVAGENTMKAEINAWKSVASPAVPEQLNVSLTATSELNPRELSYFLSDSVFQYFTNWTTTDVTLEGQYSPQKTNVTKLDVQTKGSHLKGAGNIYGILERKNLRWDGLNISATLGSDFKSTLTAFIGALKVPESISVNVISSGSPGKMFIDGEVKSDRGLVKAKGFISPQNKNVGLDLMLTGNNVDISEWVNTPWLGTIDVTANTKGVVGVNQNLLITGALTDTKVFDQQLNHVTFESSLTRDSASVNISIADSSFRSETESRISFANPMIFKNDIKLDHFQLGRITSGDTTFAISGESNSLITIGKSSFETQLNGKDIVLQNQAQRFDLGNLSLNAAASQDSTYIDYLTSNGEGTFSSNFDIRQWSDIVQSWTGNLFKVSKNNDVAARVRPRTARFDFEFENEKLLRLLGIDVDHFSYLRIVGDLDERKHTSMIEASTGSFGGYGISVDTLYTTFAVSGDSVHATLNSDNLFYDSLALGDLRFQTLTEADTAVTTLSLISDSLRSVFLGARIVRQDSAVLFYPDTLHAFGMDYRIQAKSPILVGSGNFAADHFQITRDDMQVKVNGDLNAFEMSLQNVDVALINNFLSGDSTVVNNGNLSAELFYSKAGQINLKANVDSLSLYHSSPLAILATAESKSKEVPFQVQITNESNKIDLHGTYLMDSATVDAALKVDVKNLELFTFLVSDFIQKMNGSVKGETTINGPIAKPALKGHVQFENATLTTVNPHFNFNIENSGFDLDHSAFLFNDFKLFDDEHNPLTVNGRINLKDYETLEYDIKVNSDNYTLLNTPDSIGDNLRGVLVLGSDIHLKGDGKDTDINARMTIRDKTNVTLESSADKIELINAEGIVDFVDPAQLYDSVAREGTISFYDSLIASLPDFNLTSTVNIEENARLRIIIDPQSGDYIKTSGSAALELAYDRTGNLSISGNYTIKEGMYRLSFYDLVKKNFTLLPGSSINWNGSPENGDLNIKAVHTVASNSIGLIGHEIGENEKAIYKRSLDYEVGININGTIEKPVISFSLDLPTDEKTNYPVLATKLDRLRQPEYATELNKQVFGLLVLGGFIPESSGTDVNSTLVATTAISNSVNALLASQLNRFASQYIKGVNIDVGIQSFSDYSTPGGKTQTAMDFRVSKSIMNDRLSFEVGGDFDINKDQSGAKSGTKNYRGDIAIIYDLTGNGDKQLKLFNNETYDIIYQEIRNTGVSVIFIREFATRRKHKAKDK